MMAALGAAGSAAVAAAVEKEAGGEADPRLTRLDP